VAEAYFELRLKKSLNVWLRKAGSDWARLVTSYFCANLLDQTTQRTRPMDGQHSVLFHGGITYIIWLYIFHNTAATSHSKIVTHE